MLFVSVECATGCQMRVLFFFLDGCFFSQRLVELDGLCINSRSFLHSRRFQGKDTSMFANTMKKEVLLFAKGPFWARDPEHIKVRETVPARE